MFFNNQCIDTFYFSSPMGGHHQTSSMCFIEYSEDESVNVNLSAEQIRVHLFQSTMLGVRVRFSALLVLSEIKDLLFACFSLVLLPYSWHCRADFSGSE